MAKFQPAPGEALAGSGPMSLFQKSGLTKKPFQGKIYVTNQRVCFYMDLSGSALMDLPLAEVKGFSVSKTLFITQVTIHSQSGEEYPLTGFPAKNLQTWLRQVGVQAL